MLCRGLYGPSILSQASFVTNTTHIRALDLPQFSIDFHSFTPRSRLQRSIVHCLLFVSCPLPDCFKATLLGFLRPHVSFMSTLRLVSRCIDTTGNLAYSAFSHIYPPPPPYAIHTILPRYRFHKFGSVVSSWLERTKTREPAELQLAGAVLEEFQS